MDDTILSSPPKAVSHRPQAGRNSSPGTRYSLPFLDALPFYVLLIDEAHHIQFANQAVTRSMGKTPQDLIGQYCPKVVHGLDHAFPGCPLEAALKSGTIVERELYDEQHGRWVRSAIYPTTQRTRDGLRLFVHMIHDITAQKTAEQEAAHRGQIQGVLNELLSESLASVSLEAVLERTLSKVTSVSWLALLPKGAIFLVEHEPEVLVMKAQKELAPPLLSACARVPFGHCLCGRAAQSREIAFADCLDERHVTRYDGIQPHGHYCVPIIASDKSVTGVLNLYAKEKHQRDGREEAFLRAVADLLAGIIERKRAEAEVVRHQLHLEELVAERTRQLQTTQAELVRKEKLATIGKVANSMAHELRNPMGIMHNAIYVLNNAQIQDLPEKSLRYLQMIDEQIERANRLITALADFAQTRPPQRQPTPISKIIDWVLAEQKIAPSVQVVKVTPFDAPLVLIDPEQLHTAFAHLIRNAIQAMPEGGVLTITVQKTKDRGPRRIEAAQQCRQTPLAGSAPPASEAILQAKRYCESDDTASAAILQVSISDSGGGIAPEHMSRLFEPLFSTKTYGVGFGLAIARNFVEQNGGTISVESEPGKGTTFTVRLPTTEAEFSDR